jgi:hypothetical protein
MQAMAHVLSRGVRQAGDDDKWRRLRIGHLAQVQAAPHDLAMAAWSPEDVTTIISGLFEINAKLGDISNQLEAIRLLLEEDDGREDEEED